MLKLQRDDPIKYSLRNSGHSNPEKNSANNIKAKETIWMDYLRTQYELSQIIGDVILRKGQTVKSWTNNIPPRGDNIF